MPSSLSKRRPLATLFISLCLPILIHAVEPVRIVATGGRIGYTFYTPATANTAFRHRTPHVLGGPVAEIQIGFMDWMYTDKTETANATNNVTITHAWLERAATGEVIPLTFSGQRTLVLPMNSTTPYWLSDPIPSSAWSGTAPVRDEVFWVHARGAIPEGGKVPVGTPANYTGGARFVVYPPANDTGQVDAAGPVPAVSGGSNRTEGLPLVFLGRYAEPGHLAVIGIGDSILNGSGDYTGGAIISGFGFFNRAAIDADGANAIATFNLTRHGQSAAAFINPARQTRQTPFLQFANVVVEEYGTNDLGSGGTGDPAAILDRLETIWSLARDAGVQKIIRTTLMPRTTSTDSWATSANQTPNPGWGDGEKRDNINAGLRTALTEGKIDVLLDTLPVLAAPADDNRWLTNGTSKYVTTDGTHVGPAGNALLATALRSALLSITVDENAPNYGNWSRQFDWGPANASPEADPDNDGITNLLAYALDLNPLAPVPSAALPRVTLDTSAPNGPWLALEYRENTRAADLIYTVKSSTDLHAWTDIVPDGVTTISEIAQADPDGDGGAIIRRLRTLHAGGTRFLRLGVLR